MVAPEDIYPRLVAPSAHRLAGVPRLGAWLLIGGLRTRRCATGSCLYNSMFLLDPEGSIRAVHDKRDLVPVVEGALGPFKSKLGVTPGEEPVPLSIDGTQIGVLICYESMDPRLARLLVRRGAEILLNPTSEYFQVHSAEPAQHLALAAFRAAELGRWIVRASASEGSAIIDPQGLIRRLSPAGEPHVLLSEVASRRGRTLYCIGGDSLALVSASWPLAIAIFRYLRRRTTQQKTAGFLHWFRTKEERKCL